MFSNKDIHSMLCALEKNATNIFIKIEQNLHTIHHQIAKNHLFFGLEKTYEKILNLIDLVMFGMQILFNFDENISHIFLEGIMH